MRGPTRGPYLLDLVLSDFESGIRTAITRGIHANDHLRVPATVKVSVPQSEPVRRRAYDFKTSDWVGLRRALRVKDWVAFFADFNADGAG